ncbi:hypothetical protein TESG_07396 [Trichophyton tonsurans CBS 112818]|uniref:Uncharacterized protein n=1 Tax=Trichophyton tonsurans (strain CBS 112818) TaxID=647933 RepID=F2S924_TRIT1|nr:hypothetical protein TESG_07396 [Trichophyton tonsurans CBS 112818]
MAGRLDAESNDIAAQITDYKSTECEETALARRDWRGPQNLHASYSFVLPEGSDFEDETRVGQVFVARRPEYHGVHGHSPSAREMRSESSYSKFQSSSNRSSRLDERGGLDTLTNRRSQCTLVVPAMVLHGIVLDRNAGHPSCSFICLALRSDQQVTALGKILSCKRVIGMLIGRN